MSNKEEKKAESRESVVRGQVGNDVSVVSFPFALSVETKRCPERSRGCSERRGKGGFDPSLPAYRLLHFFVGAISDGDLKNR